MMPNARGEHAMPDYGGGHPTSPPGGFVGTGGGPLPLGVPANRHEAGPQWTGDGQAAQATTPQGLFAWYAPGFSDALGDRLLLFDNTDGRPLELLRLRQDFARANDFEFSLRERAHELAGFCDARYARVCRVDRLPDPGGGLAIVSEHVEGRRLSEVLVIARQRRARLTPDIALTLVTELVSAVAALHDIGPHIAHGAIGPERLVVAPGGGLLVTEYVLGPALRRVPLERAAFWRDLRIALPPEKDVAAFDQRSDVLQVGMTAVALLLGRAPGRDDYPAGLDDLLSQAEERARLSGWDESRWARFRTWLDRALQLDTSAFAHAVEAGLALDDILRGAGSEGPPAVALGRFLAQCGGGSPGEQRQAGRDEPTADVRLIAPPPSTGDTAPAFAAVLTLPREDAAVGALTAPPETTSIANALPAPRAGDAARRLLAGPRRQLLVALLALLVVLEGAYIVSRFVGGSSGRGATTGTLRVESNPPHAAVRVDGKPAGAAPASLRLSAGRHTIELSLGSRRRALVLNVDAGASLSQFVELPPETAAAGFIDVRSDPPGARVTVDGQPRGVTPLLLAGLAAGAHQVRLDSRGRSVSQAVNVEQGATANLFVPFAGGNAPTPGWLSILSPLELQVYEDAELLGTSRSERIMLPAGRHEISLVNELVGFRTSRDVQVPVGRTAEVEVSVPNGSADINAAPWAEVWIDGEKVGETPLAGVPVRLGRHRVTFKHPTLGERTLDCLVTVHQAVRLSADLRK